MSIGPLIIDLETTQISAEEREILTHPLVGGVIFFARHFESREQIAALCREIRGLRKTPLLLMVDQEGGRVQRFKQDFTPLPTMEFIGELYDQDAKKALIFAESYGWLMARELLEVGVDLSLAPVVDLNKNLNTVIGDRAFHSDPSIVKILAQAVIQGMKAAGMAAVAKHFPGHGNVTVDSHLALPIDNRLLSEITSSDLIPFTKLMNDKLPAIMSAHILFPQVDDKLVSYSSFWLQNILRNQLGFKGVIFSDDLSMEGANISKHYEDRVREAIIAGCDFTLLCNHRVAVIQVLDRLPNQHFKVAYEKWRALQGQFSTGISPFQLDNKWQKAQKLLLHCTQSKTLEKQ